MSFAGVCGLGCHCAFEHSLLTIHEVNRHSAKMIASSDRKKSC